MLSLGQVPIGQTVTIVAVGGERGFRRRVMELGLLPGTPVKIMRVAPLGDPFELVVRGCQLSIRKSEAECIEVTERAERADALPTRAVPLRSGVPVAP